MTDATDMDEYDTVLGVMIAEREDDRTKLNAAQLGIVRHLARLTISDDPKDAKILADLLPLAPHVIRPGAMPPLTLERMDRDDAPLDISRLSNADLVELERLHAVMAGRAVPLPNERIESALALAWLLDGADGEPDIGRVRELVVEVVGAELVARVFPDGRDELAAERQRRLAVEEELKRAQHALDLAAQALPANVVRLRREQQA
jgi:hypothetical protein